MTPTPVYMSFYSVLSLWPVRAVLLPILSMYQNIGQKQSFLYIDTHTSKFACALQRDK
jgi:uncharacterized BrkB/YihY/UPF0761 family membrane protein